MWGCIRYGVYESVLGVFGVLVNGVMLLLLFVTVVYVLCVIFGVLCMYYLVCCVCIGVGSVSHLSVRPVSTQLSEIRLHL